MGLTATVAALQMSQSGTTAASHAAHAAGRDSGMRVPWNAVVNKGARKVGREFAGKHIVSKPPKGKHQEAADKNLQLPPPQSPVRQKTLKPRDQIGGVRRIWGMLKTTTLGAVVNTIKLSQTPLDSLT